MTASSGGEAAGQKLQETAAATSRPSSGHGFPGSRGRGGAGRSGGARRRPAVGEAGAPRPLDPDRDRGGSNRGARERAIGLGFFVAG